MSVFSGYLVFNGYRVLVRKRSRSGVAALGDKTVHGVMLSFAAVMVAVGTWTTVTGVFDLSPVLLVFGVIGAGLAVQQIRDIRRPDRAPSAWLRRHVTFMGAAFIAIVTASVTVNLPGLPPLVQWLGPTLVGSPLIAYAVKKHTLEPARASMATELAGEGSQ